ncbi:MAG: glycosyltransferase family 39 protein [Desulfobacterales bacterium]
MADYERMAKNIRQHFNFSWEPFWQSYVTPTMPAFRAFQCILFGESLLAWRYFQTIILFAGALWLAYEIFKISLSTWLALGFFLIVSLSKPSIFWSLKVARESLAEAFIYITIASSFASFRTSRKIYFLFTGIFFGLSLLNRPNFFLAIPAFVLLILIVNIFSKEQNKKLQTAKITFGYLAAFLLGLALIWGPWVLHTYKLYGHPVLLSTQAPYSFFWEHGEQTISDDNGETIKFSTQTLQAEAGSKFKNDYQAYVYGNYLVRKWLKTNWRYFLSRIPLNIEKSLTDSNISLTKVSRDKLFSDWRNNILIDKTSFLMCCGIIGFFLWSWRMSLWCLSLPIISILPWINGAIMISYPRMFEPSITIILFGNLLLLHYIKLFCSKYFLLKSK